MSDSLRPHELWNPRNSPCQNTRVGSHSLLQGIILTQELNWGLLHCRWILYKLSYQGSHRILEWVAFPFSRASSRLRNWTGVTWIAGEFSTSWATREAYKARVCLFFCRERIQYSRNVEERRHIPIRGSLTGLERLGTIWKHSFFQTRSHWYMHQIPWVETSQTESWSGYFGVP